jgi:FAD/FMN-containing dehydrogenase/Fe-S oxidoreductase
MSVAIAYWDELKASFSGDIFLDEKTLYIYSTDASVYKEKPLAVVLPKNENDIKLLIHFAKRHKTFLIPRAAGTSLGGQVVGSGIIVDISKYFNKILEFNQEEKWVKVQPGVIRDDLNKFLAPYGLHFTPETSTANRAMIGGMIGNNSCGTNSIKYGTTRDHVISLDCILSDTSNITFKNIDNEYFKIINKELLEGKIYNHIHSLLKDNNTRKSIIDNFPKPSIHRRNTGYALDELCQMQPFNPEGKAFNLSSLICGSEGTLAFTIASKLNLVELPPKEKVILCVHFNSLSESLLAVVSSMDFEPYACELMDKIILDCTKENKEQLKNRFFVEGDPEAILCIEFCETTMDLSIEKANQLISILKTKNFGYSYPIIKGSDTKKVWDLRKAGLGVLANIPGDKKAVAVIEDTAVDVKELPSYIEEFTAMMQHYNQRTVYYAHAGAGELHLRPILDLKNAEDRVLFRKIAEETALLVKKYRGSLSGEHGDGRVRGEFIPWMIGSENYQRLIELKKVFDPDNIFNPGKITDTPPMDKFLRYENNQETKTYNDTVFNFSKDGGILRTAEKCNGSGDCRKTHLSGGTMCPSYMATKDEKDTTRARANILRTFLTDSHQINAFDHEEILNVMDLCLSCKGCSNECPSNVDVSTLKAEFLFQYYKNHFISLRSLLFGYIGTINKSAILFPRLSNFFLENKFFSNIIKKGLKVAPKRDIPTYYHTTLYQWWVQNNIKYRVENPIKEVLLFADEFTNYNDVSIGILACKVLYKLGYNVNMLEHADSGRALLSKGIVDAAQECAITNVTIFASIVNDQIPLLGIEPSGILTFKDEYPRLVPKSLEENARNLAKNCMLIDDFIYNEYLSGALAHISFDTSVKDILFHGHCHQKALSGVNASAFLMSIPPNYSVETMPSGCCGMAGSFGYESEHYQVSIDISNLVLAPNIEKRKSQNCIIAATGTSCRHQIKDTTNQSSLHPIEIFYRALL